MSNKNSSLQDALIKFLGELLECLNGTTFSSDRPIYLQDIAITSSWIVDLSHNQNERSVAEKIVDSSTSKQFGDYFRQGEFGDKEAEALKSLQKYAAQFL